MCSFAAEMQLLLLLLLLLLVEAGVLMVVRVHLLLLLNLLLLLLQLLPCDQVVARGQQLLWQASCLITRQCGLQESVKQHHQQRQQLYSYCI
jgi:hypothetical protein